MLLVYYYLLYFTDGVCPVPTRQGRPLEARGSVQSGAVFVVVVAGLTTWPVGVARLESHVVCVPQPYTFRLVVRGTQPEVDVVATRYWGL